MPNILQLTVEEPDKILNPGAYGAGAVIRLQSSATEDGVYADVTGTGSTPTTVIVAGDRSYDAYDPAGTASTWYRTRFENVGASRLSDWSAPFQVAPEGAGLIVGLWDVKQALGQSSTSANDEDILERIRQVTTEIIGFTKRWFLRTPSSGTDTFLLDVEQTGRTLWVPQGIAELTSLEVATYSQPETGGVYTTVPVADWMLRPSPASRDYGWPATRIELGDYPTGAIAEFTAGHNTIRLVGALGWESVPPDISAIGERAVVASYLTKGSASGGAAVIGPTGKTTILRHISPADRTTLERYRYIPIH